MWRWKRDRNDAFVRYCILQRCKPDGGYRRTF